jgi:muramoyltetrapeptide carboxypeptidase
VDESPRRHEVRPARLRPGDTVAVISPAGPAAGLFGDRLARAREYLRRRFGLHVRLMPHATAVSGSVSAEVHARVADIHSAFADSDIKAVFCAVGGHHSAQMLPHVDWSLIAANPKVFVGFSDVTCLHHAIAVQTGLITFYGPMVMTQWGEAPEPHPYTAAGFQRVVMGDQAPSTLQAAPEWTDERADWAAGTDGRGYRPSNGLRVLRPGAGEGLSLAGCTSSVRDVIGTRWLPDYSGRVVLLEPAAGVRAAAVANDLTHLRNCGLLDRLSALLVGRPCRMSDAAELDRAVLEAVAGTGYPVVADVDCGHTDPMATFPIGIRVAVRDASIRFLESAVL